MSCVPSSRTIVCKEVFDENSIPSEEGKGGCFEYVKNGLFSVCFRFRRRCIVVLRSICI